MLKQAFSIITPIKNDPYKTLCPIIYHRPITYCAPAQSYIYDSKDKKISNTVVSIVIKYSQCILYNRSHDKTNDKKIQAHNNTAIQPFCVASVVFQLVPPLILIQYMNTTEDNNLSKMFTDLFTAVIAGNIRTTKQNNLSDI